jgi:hypothetical protein
MLSNGRENTSKSSHFMLLSRRRLFLLNFFFSIFDLFNLSSNFCFLLFLSLAWTGITGEEGRRQEHGLAVAGHDGFDFELMVIGGRVLGSDLVWVI